VQGTHLYRRSGTRGRCCDGSTAEGGDAGRITWTGTSGESLVGSGLAVGGGTGGMLSTTMLLSSCSAGDGARVRRATRPSRALVTPPPTIDICKGVSNTRKQKKVFGRQQITACSDSAKRTKCMMADPPPSSPSCRRIAAGSLSGDSLSPSGRTPPRNSWPS
jgi:hypothetical protein